MGNGSEIYEDRKNIQLACAIYRLLFEDSGTSASN
jgi:hypothetical protein